MLGVNVQNVVRRLQRRPSVTWKVTLYCHCKKIAGDVSLVKLCGSAVDWCGSIKYLQCGCSIILDIKPNKRAFYAACNMTFLHSSGVNQLALLNLQETFSLCVIM